jgi:branched-subunit amino acid transport protein AzlD
MTEPTNPESRERHLQASPYLVVLIVAAAMVVILQYTPYMLFPAEKTSTLWGVLVGLVLGGFIFGWLGYRRSD